MHEDRLHHGYKKAYPHPARSTLYDGTTPSKYESSRQKEDDKRDRIEDS